MREVRDFVDICERSRLTAGGVDGLADAIGHAEDVGAWDRKHGFVLPRRRLLQLLTASMMVPPALLFWPRDAMAFGFNAPYLLVPATPGPTVNVGAPGSGPGGANDVALIKAAWDAVKASGGTVSLAAGATYNLGASGVSARVAIDANAKPVRIKGTGTIFRAANGSITNSFANAMLDIVNPTNVVFTGLTLDGNRANRAEVLDTECCNFRVTSGNGVFFLDCVSDNSPAQDGWLIRTNTAATPSTFPQNVLLYRCKAHNNHRLGLAVINGLNIQVISGEYNTTHGQQPGAGIDFEPNPGSANPGINGALVRGVICLNNKDKAVQFGGPVGLINWTMEGCYLAGNNPGASGENTTSLAAGVDAVSQSVVIRKNTFENLVFPTAPLAIRAAINIQGGFSGVPTLNVFIDDNTFNGNQLTTAEIFVHSAQSAGSANVQITNNRRYHGSPVGSGNFVQNGAGGLVTANTNNVDFGNAAPVYPVGSVAGDPIGGVPPWTSYLNQTCFP